MIGAVDAHLIRDLQQARRYGSGPAESERSQTCTGRNASGAAVCRRKCLLGPGGTTLADTVGGSLERGGRAGDLVVVLALWAAVVLKVIAAVLPLLAIYRLGGMRWQRPVVVLTWIEAAVLVIYGLVLTTVGLMVQLGVIAASTSADHRALAWHAYLWDPWFLVWGLLVTAALLRTRHRTKNTTKLDDDRQPS